jgi:large subunit ribosomal protein L17
MRHGVKINKLSRTASHRKAMLSNMASQLIEYKRIVTTLAKAKALRVYVEPLLTKGKKDDTNNRRVVFSHLQNKEAIKELFSTVAEKIANRNGGYTRIIKLPNRVGDAAEMAMIELVDFNELYTGKAGADKAAKKTRRSRTSAGTTSKKVSEPKATPAAEAAPKAEDSTEAVAAPVVEEVAASVVEAAATIETEVTATESESTQADDLKIVEGIGPKIAEIFASKGISTFAQLAAANVDDLKAILVEAGPSYAGKDPSTWPQQGQMAADGKWDELKAWQDELKGGKEA